jgi:hypothetical protein
MKQPRVAVLLRRVDFEGDELIGVFSSAQVARQYFDWLDEGSWEKDGKWVKGISFGGWVLHRKGSDIIVQMHSIVNQPALRRLREDK